MKKIVQIILLLTLSIGISFGQSDKKEQRKNMTVKEWKTPVKGTKFLDHTTKYDEKGRKIEEIEYRQSGMKARCTYEYNDKNQIVREVVYDENNKAYRIRKFEYNDDGTKKRQLNYSPKGNLISVKTFEYIRN